MEYVNLFMFTDEGPEMTPRFSLLLQQIFNMFLQAEKLFTLNMKE